MKASDMLTPLTSQQAVLLHDGRVLVSGGEPFLGSDPVPWTQLYDPARHTWSSGQSMHVGRIGDTVTVLADGRVLVVGDLGPKLRPLDSAELFDPRAGTWQLLPWLPGTRFSQSADLLLDGRVLLAGGIVNGRIARSTLLFDPARNAFQPAPPMQAAHAQHCSARLDDGSILIAGGYGGGPELYAPRSTSWTTVGRLPFRGHPIMTTLQDGRVLLASGTSARERDVASAYLFDPVSGRWKATGRLHVRRNTATGTLLPNGQVLVAGGEQGTGELLGSAEVYDPIRGRWEWTDPLQVARTGATATMLRDGTVLVCGGAAFDGPLASCEQYRPR